MSAADVGKLQEGWCWAKVEAVTQNFDGRRVPIKADDRKKRQGAFPYYGASGAIDCIDDYIFDGNYLLVAEDGANLLSRSTPIAFQAKGQFWVNNHAHVLQPVGDLPFEFLEFFFNQHDLQEYVTGSAQPKLTQAALNRIPIPLPPLAEQQRIVATVERVLARVTAARDRLNRVPATLKRFRQAVLAAACSGRLSEDWREVSGKYADEDSDVPNSWEVRGLRKLCTAFQYGSSQKSAQKGKLPVLRMGNIQDGKIDWADLVYSNDDAEIEKYSLAANTVLFNRTNSPELVGKTALYRGEKPAIFAGYLVRVVTGPELDPQFLNLALNAPAFKDYCQQVKTDGVSQSNINAQKLADYEINWCPIPEQKEIVRRVGELFALADAIEAKLTAARRKADALTQAVLAKAFRGELVPTEADLARAEGRAYEPAGVLLERLRAERAATHLASPRRRGNNAKGK